MLTSNFLKLSAAILLLATSAAAAGKHKFNGVISDSMCSDGNHSHMRMGPTDTECAIACNGMHDATFVLYDGKDVYTLSDQHLPAKFAGKKVTVRGTLDASKKTIQVDAITAAK